MEFPTEALLFLSELSSYLRAEILEPCLIGGCLFCEWVRRSFSGFKWERSKGMTFFGVLLLLGWHELSIHRRCWWLGFRLDLSNLCRFLQRRITLWWIPVSTRSFRRLDEGGTHWDFNEGSTGRKCNQDVLEDMAYKWYYVESQLVGMFWLDQTWHFVASQKINHLLSIDGVVGSGNLLGRVPQNISYFLLSGSASTSPFRTSVAMRRNVFCQTFCCFAGEWLLEVAACFVL